MCRCQCQVWINAWGARGKNCAPPAQRRASTSPTSAKRRRLDQSRANVPKSFDPASYRGPWSEVVVVLQAAGRITLGEIVAMAGAEPQGAAQRERIGMTDVASLRRARPSDLTYLEPTSSAALSAKRVPPPA